MHREHRLIKFEKTTKITPMPTLYANKGSLKLINKNLQSHCNPTKTSPLNAELNSLSNEMSCIQRIDC